MLEHMQMKYQNISQGLLPTQRIMYGTIELL